MRKITLLFCLLMFSVGFAQTDMIENFDGTAPGLTPDNAECTAIGLNISTAQSVSGPNSLEIIAQAAGNPWQGAQVMPQGIGGMDLTTNLNMTVEVYSLVPAGILAKVTDGTGPDGTSAANHTGSGWETLSYNFSDQADGSTTANGVYPTIRFYPLWGAGGYAGQGGAPCVSDAPNTIYVDNIMGTLASGETCTDGILNNGEEEIDCGGPNCAACPNPPSAAPTAPPNRAAADVASVYSNAYTTSPTDGFQTFGGAVVTEIDYSGNTIQSVTTPVSGAGLQYQYFGVSPQYLDLTEFDFMHIDFYFEGTAATAGTVLLVIAQYSDGTNIQKTFDVTGLAPSTWHEMDVAFADFDLNPTNARDQIQQVIVQTAGPDVYGPFYFDNLYFHKNTLGTEDFNRTTFRAFPNPTNGDWNISGSTVINKIAVYDILGKQVMALTPNTNETIIDASSLKSGIYFARIEGNNGSKTVKLIKQ